MLLDPWQRGECDVDDLLTPMLRELVEHCKTVQPGHFERRATIDRSVEFFRSEMWGEFTVGIRVVLHEFAQAVVDEFGADDERVALVGDALDHYGRAMRSLRKGVRDL